MKRKSLKTLLAFIILTAMLFTMSTVHADGETLRMSTTKTEYYVGDTISVSVIASANTPALSSIQFSMKFDPAKIDFISGSVNGSAQGSPSGAEVSIPSGKSGIVTAYAYGYSITSKTIATLKFKAKTVTSAVTFSLSDMSLQSSTFGDIAPTSQGALTIAITPPPVLSSNADLKSLTIAPGALAPAFSSDNTVYSAMVSDTTTNLTVSAAVADAKAEVSVSGNKNLQPGENTVKIVVTAESGATKTYTIKVTRTALTPTPSPSPTPAPTPTPGATVSVNGSTMTIAPLDAGKTPPTGFSEATINLQNQMVPAYVSQSGGITLLYLKNSSGAGAFYVYDATDGSFLPFVSITIPARVYVLLPVDGVTAPAGFKPAPMSIAGQTASGFQAEQPGADGSLATLVYLMDSSGIKALYTWNAKASELNRYIAGDTPQVTTTPSPTLTPTTAAQTGNGTATGGDINLLPYILAIAGFAALSVVLGALLLYKQYGNRRNTTGRPQPPPIRRVD